MFKFHNWRIRMYAPDGGVASGAQAPGTNAAPAGSQNPAPAVQQPAAQQPAQGQQVQSGTPQGSQNPLTEQQRHDNAARRRAEQDQELQSLRATQAEADRIAKARGFADFGAMVRASDDELLQKALKDGTLSAETLRQVMQPVVQQSVQPILSALSGELEQRDVHDELAEFNQRFPNEGIKEIIDFGKKPYFEKLRGYIDKGLTLIEAYKLANDEELSKAQTAAVKQQTLNQVNEKAHMTPAAGSAEGVDTTVVPADVYQNYRRFNPKMTDAQIRAHYAKSMKG